MTKGKYIYEFEDGSKMIDRNNYKTLGEAKSWARSHNRGTKGKKILQVLRRPATRKRLVKRDVIKSGWSGIR